MTVLGIVRIQNYLYGTDQSGFSYKKINTGGYGKNTGYIYGYIILFYGILNGYNFIFYEKMSGYTFIFYGKRVDTQLFLRDLILLISNY